MALFWAAVSMISSKRTRRRLRRDHLPERAPEPFVLLSYPLSDHGLKEQFLGGIVAVKG